MENILLLDEQPLSRLQLKEALSAAYQVYEATSADEALGLARSQRIALIVLDMERSDDNGAELCARLKAAQETRYTPLILLSSHGQKEAIINGMHAGAEDYMGKPVNVPELLARIETHLRGKDYYAELAKADLLMLLALAEIINVTRNPQRILRIIVEKVAEVVDVSRCSILAIDEHGELIVKASSDLPTDQELKLELSKYPEIEKALVTRRPVVLSDMGRDPLLAPVREKLPDLSGNAIFVIPIIKKQNVIGTFFLRTAVPLKRGITERVFKLCQVVANISGNALENAVLFESMQSSRRLLEDQVLRDGLTTLYNQQHFHHRAEVEFSRAQRYALPLSCLFIDLDEFKNVNDRFGHIAGDVVLKKTGLLIGQMLRKSDLACRYGGDEFAVLLANSDRQGAGEFAARLLALIGGLCVAQIAGTQISASIGIATYRSGNLPGYAELLHCADVAMYEAKKSGGSRICHAGGAAEPPPCC